MEGGFQMLPPLFSGQDSGMALQGADQTALSAHFAAMAGLPAGSAINMDLLNMGLASMTPGNPRFLMPPDGTQQLQENSTLIQI